MQRHEVEDAPVLVKFGCKAVHKHFVSLTAAFRALREMRDDQAARDALSSVLLALLVVKRR